MHGHSQWETLTRRLDASDGGAINVLEYEMVPASLLRDGDLVLYAAGDVISATGEIVRGGASIDTANSRADEPPMRASPDKVSAVVRGMRVISGWIAVRVGGGM